MSAPNRVYPLIGTAVAIVYSLAVIASSTPRFSNFPVAIVALYYLFVPGYVIMQYVNEDYAIIQKIALSVILGLTLILVVFSAQQVIGSASSLPFYFIIPIVTILLVTLNFYRTRKTSILAK